MKITRLFLLKCQKLQTQTKETREIVALKEREFIDPRKLKTHNINFNDIQNAYEMYAD